MPQNLSPEEFCAFIAEHPIKDQDDKLLKLCLRKAYKYAGRDGEEAKPKKYRRWVHVAGAQSMKLRQGGDKDEDDFGPIRKMFKENKDDYRDADQMIQKAQETLDARMAKRAEDADGEDGEDVSDSEDDDS